MIRSTFQLAPGVGPYRERQLWSAGITTWDAFPGEGRALSPGLDVRLRAALGSARAALGAGDAGRLAAMLPRRERWRLFGAFAEDAGYLDIETDGGHEVTSVGVLDRDGPRLFLHGRDLEAFPAATRGWKMVVTFNGASFDLPVLRRAFPRWRPPRCHVDLRQLWGRLGHQGGLKRLERETGLGRPPHLDGLSGLDAVWLWRRHLAGERQALRLLAEYNLYDAVNLRTLMALGYNRLLERLRLPAAPVPVSFRGDVLYDLTREVLRL
ncbi:MAG TPA: ribonuclease H-like domain-containing protein [Anaeromyxobacteraceae bacterium]|nr:ribonuclease H-like domain-containing protein [Anaeromyxobacteraceae bacterium]